ncbi:hypothetical protein V495_00323 [Pseudogymnoascus sp. VKM F-4514 (FW-929)]|nr:hypothetical protein V495_00323 [Pseudogymnoascus sp. VKM F-4514 (FW-929)]KFY66804.1 hypothetical protein V497_00687 [Pseudogymnoascus sp. VKM F-4516 (FW-969)]
MDTQFNNEDDSAKKYFGVDLIKSNKWPPVLIGEPSRPYRRSHHLAAETRYSIHRAEVMFPPISAVGLCQGGAYAQCGGMSWTGATTCVSGYTCAYSNAYYSQCLPSLGVSTLKPTTTIVTAPAGSPTLYLCGDSTMAKGGAGDGDTDGWVPVLIPVKVDLQQLLQQPSEETTLLLNSDITMEDPLLHRNAAKLLGAKGVYVIISSATPNNLWESGTWAYSASRFSTMSKAAAENTGGTFVDHGYFVADRYKQLGEATVDAYYPNDHTHTSPTGANTVAQTFFRGLLCSKSQLGGYLTGAGKRVPAQTCGGI